MKKNIHYSNYFKNFLSAKNEKIRFNKIFEKIISNLDTVEDTYGFLSKNFKINLNFKELNKFKKFKTIIIIGMGGSVLGSSAIYNFFNEKIKKKVFFFDNLDSKKISDFKRKNNANKCLFIVISKSGNTIETLANFISLNIIKKKAKNIIIISERKENILFALSKRYNLFFIEHRKFLGGRYSVLSEVGLVPAYLMGLNIKKLRKNLLSQILKNKKFLKESTAILANILNKKIFKNIVFLNYSPKLESFLLWLQQLISESLGKKGKGFLPTLSNNPKDHHSIFQLYLDGPKDKIFYLFEMKDENNIHLKTKSLHTGISYLDNKKIDKLKSAQQKAVKKIFIKNKTPFREFSIKAANEDTLGELFTYFMLEISIIGKIANINPFNQPAVEQIKINTKKLLK